MAGIRNYLKSPAKNGVKIAILDEAGQPVRALTGPGGAGINRIWWDLKHEGPNRPKLRTAPPGNPHVWEEDRFKDYKDEGFPLVSWGIGGGQTGPRVEPGTYTVKMSVGGRDFTQKLVVRKDPKTSSTEADIRAQVKMSLELRDQIDEVVAAINKIEWAKKQLEDLAKTLEDDKSASPILAAAAALHKKLVEVEETYTSIVLTEGDSKSFRAPVGLYSELAVLAGDVMTADFPPTNPMKEVQELLNKNGAVSAGKLDAVMGKEVAAFNALLKAKNIQPINPQQP